MASEPKPALAERIPELVALMRAAGTAVGTNQVIAAERAIRSSAADAGRERTVLRATLCSAQADLRVLDSVIAQMSDQPAAELPPPEPGGRALADRSPAATGEPGDELELAGEWSSAQILRQKAFRGLDDAEREAIWRAIRRLASEVPQSPSSRTRPGSRRGERLDIGATAREAVRSGDVLELRWRQRRTQPRPVVAVCDASRSMSPFLRPLLEYLQALAAARPRVEVFVFSTRLTRITPELRSRDVDEALLRATAAAPDWEGGTRIGEAVAELNRRHGGRVGRGSNVLFFSDGWDRGDPEELRRELERLRRCAHRLIWVNPHAAQPGFEPLTRGMAAALPSLDHLRAANNLGDLESLVDLLAQET